MTSRPEQLLARYDDLAEAVLERATVTNGGRTVELRFRGLRDLTPGEARDFNFERRSLVLQATGVHRASFEAVKNLHPGFDEKGAWALDEVDSVAAREEDGLVHLTVYFTCDRQIDIMCGAIALEV